MNPEPASAGAAGRIAVIIGSTRPTRICPGIAHWSAHVLRQESPLCYEIIDLADAGLPFLDEPLKPALGDYRHEHTPGRGAAWSAATRGSCSSSRSTTGGYPAPVKNALDFLYREWHGKPATSVTYGTRGGGKAADQLRHVLEGLHMRPLATPLEITITDRQVDEDWQLTDLAATMQPYAALTRRIDAEMIEVLEDSQ